MQNNKKGEAYNDFMYILKRTSITFYQLKHTTRNKLDFILIKSYIENNMFNFEFLPFGLHTLQLSAYNINQILSSIISILSPVDKSVVFNASLLLYRLLGSVTNM